MIQGIQGEKFFFQIVQKNGFRQFDQELKKGVRVGKKEVKEGKEKGKVKKCQIEIKKFQGFNKE